MLRVLDLGDEGLELELACRVYGLVVLQGSSLTAKLKPKTKLLTRKTKPQKP